jgi:starch synthase
LCAIFLLKNRYYDVSEIDSCSGIFLKQGNSMLITKLTPKPRVAFISAETEHCRVGGLAEVTNALPPRIKDAGISITRFTPLHSVVWASAGKNLREVHFDKYPEILLLGLKVGVAAYELKDAEVPTVYFKDVSKRTDKDEIEGQGIREIFLNNFQALNPGQTALDQAINNACFSRFFYQGRVYPEGVDLGEKFFFAVRAVLELIKSGRFDKFDLIHFQDWHFSLIPSLIRFDSRYQELSELATVGTVHNIFSWRYFPEEFEKLSGLTQSEQSEIYSSGNGSGLFHKDGIDFLKGILYADMVNTVSPTFALELTTYALKDNFYDFFRYLYDKGKFIGILNGIDARWDPSDDKHIPSKFSADDYSGKEQCKDALRNKFQLTNHSSTPVIAVISRIAVDKGFDILIPSIETLVQSGAQLYILGSGNQNYLDQMIYLSQQYPGMIAIKSDYYEEKDAHLAYAGADIFIRPSFYEPCGLSQMVAMKYGAVPIVHKTGGLADTVFDIDEKPDKGNGFAFSDYTKEALLEKTQRAIDTFQHNPALWQTMRLRGMRADFSWDRSVEQYLNLYQRALENAKKRRN